MSRYKNIRSKGDVLGVAPGETIEIVLSADQQRQLIRGGHIAIEKVLKEITQETEEKLAKRNAEK